MGHWFLEQLTVSNIIILLTVVGGIGGYIESFRTLRGRVQSLEDQRIKDIDANEKSRQELMIRFENEKIRIETEAEHRRTADLIVIAQSYMRQDVHHAIISSIDHRLHNIEDDVRTLRLKDKQ